MTALPSHLQNLVDTLCERGCTAVNCFIEDLENGKNRDELSTLPDADKHEVLAELKDIMQVYERPCDD